MNVVMKIGALFLASSILTGAYASSSEEQKLKSTMKSFSMALELIQHGILYNKKDEMYKGSQLLSKDQQRFMQLHGNTLKEHIPQNPRFAYDYAKSTSKKIQKLTEKLNSSLGGDKDFSIIASTYGHIMQECVGCHQKIRDK